MASFRAQGSKLVHYSIYVKIKILSFPFPCILSAAILTPW